MASSTGLEVREAGRALRVQTEAPHLVSMGSGRLSTAVTLHPLPEGRIVLGSNRDADIPVVGTGVESIHCAIENNNDVVTLHPINGSTAIDGVLINSPMRLAQGCMLSIGRSNYMRFNHPAEAKQLRSVLPQSRISMAPISFSLPAADGQPQEDCHLERKPPVVPRKSPRNSYSDDEIGFLGKLTKFEMLARQSRNNCVSPKVFPAGGITTNVPADQILGHSTRSTNSQISPLSRNVHGNVNCCNGNDNANNGGASNNNNSDKSRSSTPSSQTPPPPPPSPHIYYGSSNQGFCFVDDNRRSMDSRSSQHGRSSTPSLRYRKSPTLPHRNQLQQMYSTAETYLKTYKPYYRENTNEIGSSHSPQNFLLPVNTASHADLMSRSMTIQRTSDLDELGARDFDMSQSLIVTKTTTTEYLQLEKFGSNSSICNEVVPNASHTSGGCYQTFPSPSNVKRIQPLGGGPSCHRSNSKDAAEQKKTYARGKSPTSSIGSACSLEELQERQIEAENKRREAENKRKQAQEERLKEQEVERQEKMRLEEILAMCAEYERQSTVDKPRQPNRIKTNGSLPRDKRPGYNTSPYESPKSPSKNQPHFSFDTTKQTTNTISASYENVSVENTKLVFRNSDVVNETYKEDNEMTTARMENENISNVAQDLSQATTPNNNQGTTRWSNIQANGGDHSFSNSISQARTPNYENITFDNESNLRKNVDDIQSKSSSSDSSVKESSTYGTIQLNGTKISPRRTTQNYDKLVSSNGNLSLYENVMVISASQNSNNDGSNGANHRCSNYIGNSKSDRNINISNSNSKGNNNNNNNGSNSSNSSNDNYHYHRENHSMPKRNGQLSRSCELVENKLTISNDDLLEAIEQLSMLSKSKEVSITPRRSIFEKDNVDSTNEIKAADRTKKEPVAEDREKYIEFLQNEKLRILGNMEMLKRSIADVETQEEEISRELELEKALLSAECESESLKLTQDEGEKIRVQMRINELEREMAEDNATQANLQAEAKQRVQKAQIVYNRLEENLATCTDEAIQQEINNKLIVQQDVVESERKAFEDLEFHHLEEEASKLATREELQRYLSELTSKIESKKMQLNYLESQRSEASSLATRDARSLERQKLGYLKRLEEGRNRLRTITDELDNLAQSSCENCEEKRSPSREDFDRISRVTIDSPIVNNQGSLGRKTIESLKEIERNRQLHLAKQGSQVISEERRRVEELKRRVQDEVRSQWEERKMNCASFNSVESGEESSSYSTGLTESGSGSGGSCDSAEVGNNEKLSPGKLSEITSPSPGPSNNSYSLLQNDNMKDDRRTSMDGERISNNSGGGGGIVDENESRPLSQISSEMDTIGPLQPVKHREKAKLQRPLTRYLPIKSESLDLRHHIETAGHQLPLIHDVAVNTTSCSGNLSKMSKKFHHWNKRWFVFDRKRKTLSYYSDNTSKKARGVIYFQSIEEVYVDHMNTVKSPQPSLTFIIKTSSRLYHLMAQSPEAMRVWVDVVFTGAEGYHEFDHNV